MEEAYGKCWVGKAGRELERLLRQAKIDINDCRLTNIVKYRPTTRARSGNVKPTAADIRRDEGELIDELETIRPAFVAAIGAVAARWFLGKITIEESEGFPFEASNYRKNSPALVGVEHGRSGGVARNEVQEVAHFIVVPIRHPAAGLHSPEQQPLIYWDFQQLGRYVRGELPLTRPHDEHPDPDYFEPRTSVDLIDSLPIAIDTEGLSGRVWGLSYSQIAGSAGVVRKTNRKALASFKRRLVNA